MRSRSSSSSTRTAASASRWLPRISARRDSRRSARSGGSSLQPPRATRQAPAVKRILKYAAWAVAAVLAVALGACFWAYQVATSHYETQWTVHGANFPIPFPLREDELATLRAE